MSSKCESALTREEYREGNTGRAELWFKEMSSAAVPGQVPWKRAAERVKLPFLPGICVPQHASSKSRVFWD